MRNCIEVRNLTKHYKQVEAVKNISFYVEKGQLYGFLGVNGAGKSTTINMLCTLLKKNAGEAIVCGHQLGEQDEEIRKKIGVVFQDNTLDEQLTIKENLMMRGSFYISNKDDLRKRYEHVCGILDIYELENRRFGKLSGGQKRKCEIAKSILNAPELLFLDEPTTGLDPKTRQDVWDCLEKLQKEMGMTIFLTTHYMEEAAKANYVSIMNKGEIVAKGTPAQLKQTYAHDLLKLTCNDEEQVIAILKKHNCTYNKKSNHLSVQLNQTIDSIAYLPELAPYINSYEVIQGTMDDVFLNITGLNIKEEML